MITKVRRLLQTLSYVTPWQFLYRLKYLLIPVRSLKQKKYTGDELNPIKCLPVPESKSIIKKTDSGFDVTTLNLSKSYKKFIDWADDSYGQLWNYHLQYADFLKQNDLSEYEKVKLIDDLYKWLISGKLKPEPYPASLRIMNVIRYLSTQEEIENRGELVDYLYSELHFLENRLEYHLLGNHLMENAFAILMGGVFFQEKRWIDLARDIFSEQVPEQILSDGGHFERSPMYHLILLFRFLEAIYYLPLDSDLYPLFTEIVKKMLGWIDQMSFRNGDLAHFNDSTDDQSYSKEQVLDLAKRCGINDYPSATLRDSGYKKFKNENIELILDASGIKPEYQPGHAHADSLSFIFYVNEKPIIIDPGVSTYEAGERRNWERSTKAHNTVTFKEQNTAGVWGKFRVAERPDVEIQSETDSKIEVLLKYKFQSGDFFEHRRKFSCSQSAIDISDFVNLTESVEGRLHFHPDIKIRELTKDKVILSGGTHIKFQGILHLRKFTYECSKGFNLHSKATGISYKFEKKSSLRIAIPEK